MFCTRSEICSVVNILSNPSNTRYRNEYVYKQKMYVSIHIHSHACFSDFYEQV